MRLFYDSVLGTVQSTRQAGMSDDIVLVSIGMSGMVELQVNGVTVKTVDVSEITSGLIIEWREIIKPWLAEWNASPIQALKKVLEASAEAENE